MCGNHLLNKGKGLKDYKHKRSIDIMKNLQRKKQNISELIRVSNVFERILVFDSPSQNIKIKPKGKLLIPDSWIFKFNINKGDKKDIKTTLIVKIDEEYKEILKDFFSKVNDSIYLIHNEEGVYHKDNTIYLPSKGEKALLYILTKHPKIWENSKVILTDLLQKRQIDFNKYGEEEIVSALIIINILSFGLSCLASNLGLNTEIITDLMNSKKLAKTLDLLYSLQYEILEDFVEYKKP